MLGSRGNCTLPLLLILFELSTFNFLKCYQRVLFTHFISYTIYILLIIIYIL